MYRYITQDKNGDIVKWERMPIIGNVQWMKSMNIMGSEHEVIYTAHKSDEIEIDGWKNSLIDITEDSYDIMNGVLVRV